MNEDDLKKILAKPGYGIQSGIKGTLRAGSSLSKIGGAGALDDVESGPEHAQVGPKELQIACSGRVVVRLTFYRHRLADYGEECSRAISEKAIIDGLCYAGILSGDSGKEIRYEDGGQKKVESDEEERTEVEIFYPEVDFNNLWKVKERKDGR